MIRSLVLRFALVCCALGGAQAAPVKHVALVFDDGPKPADVEPLLALLAREKITVTFSLVGDRVDEHPELVRVIVAAGHEIANHSQAHAHPKELNDAALDREIAGAQQKLTAALGRAPRWYWPPFLESDDRLRAVLDRAGLTLYMPRHLVVSMDYDRAVPAAEILRRATTDVRDGSVILFHEWRAETREQLPAILAELRRQGAEFFTFSALEAVLTAPASAAVPVGGDALLVGDVGAFSASAGAGHEDAFKFSTVDAQGLTFQRAWRLETNRDLSPAWAVEVRVRLAKAVKKGDTGFVRFYARATASTDETGAGRLRVVVQQAEPNYAKSMENTLSVGSGWQEFLMPFTFADDYGAGGAELAFGFGFKRQTIEVGGVEVLNYGRSVEPAALPKTRFSYPGREANAAWRREALARIEQIRKSDFLIEVRDAAGKPAAGVTVRVEQRRSAFQFGTALQFARLVQDTPENLIYREKALELFNAASPENDLKWQAWSGEWKGYDQKQTLLALAWLKERGMPTRGHVLVWPGWKNLPESIRKLNGSKKEQAKIPPLVLKHIADITGATRGALQEWDVLNEPFDNRDLMGLFGADIMVEWFKAAAAGAPGVPLYLNDYSNHDLVADKAHCMDFFKVAKFLQSKGAPLGGLGLQGHIGAQPNAPEQVLATLDTYAAFKLPIRITEFDIDTDDEALQADYTRDFLILAYSHPSVVGVQHWGFWAKAHWRPRGALFRADWSEKPAAAAYRALVLDQWRTKIAGVTDAAGNYSVRGFQGDYAIFVEKDGRKIAGSFVLRPGDVVPVIVVKLP